MKFGCTSQVFFQGKEKHGLPSLLQDFSISSDVTNDFSLFRKSSLFRAHSCYMTWVFFPPFLASPPLGATCFKYRPTLTNASTYTAVEPHMQTDFRGTEARSPLTIAWGSDIARVCTPKCSCIPWHRCNLWRANGGSEASTGLASDRGARAVSTTSHLPRQDKTEQWRSHHVNTVWCCSR